MAYYRIVTDDYCGYEIQVWHWWLPIWMQYNWTNTHISVEQAEGWLKRQLSRGSVVKELGRL